jgi:kinesin family protein 1
VLSGADLAAQGDFHVFRFNHPEEVRRARERVKSTLALSTGEELNETTTGSPGGTRPDSPMSNADDGGDVDWTYARREAALARLKGHDAAFDNLEPQELDKLLEDISRARSKRAGSNLLRPDSRLSSIDDGMSESAASSRVHPYSLSTYTDDTSIDPWSHGGAGSEWGSRAREPSAPATPDPDVTVDGQTQERMLRLKVKEYEEQLSRLTAADPDAPVVYTPEQRELLARVLIKWRGRTKVSMAEDVLANAVLLKEANVISRELGKQTSLQFCVVDAAPLGHPSSSIEAIAGLDEVDDVADPALANAPKPCIAVRVADHLHAATYVWSLPKLEARLAKMRNLYSFIDRPEYSQHFNWADPFYEVPAPAYSFVACALVPLCPLARRVSSKFRVPIVARHTGVELGTCSVEVKFVSLSASPSKRANGSNGSASPVFASDGELPAGHKFGLQVTVDAVEGLRAEHFSRVHVQLRLSAVAGPTLEADEVYASVPADLAANEAVKLRRTLSFLLTPAIAEHLRSGVAPIEFHARVTEAYLQTLEAHDAAKEAKRPIGRAPDAAAGQLSHKSPAAGRLAETEMVSEQRHDVLAFVQLCELDDRGEYEAVQVRAQSALDPGAFHLRQGVQRKLVLTLASDSGRQFAWTRVTSVELSQVRLLDAKGRVHVSTLGEPVSLQVPLKQQTVEFRPNGTSELRVWAWWDSGVHDSLFLNRPTPSGQRVLLRLAFTVDVESCAAPAEFSMDVAVSIGGRDAKPQGRLLSMVSAAATGARVLSKTSALFAVRLVPPPARRTRELWRLDTAAKYVRGEEALHGAWRPRGVSLVLEHTALMRRERRRAEVEGVRALLAARPPLALSSAPTDGERDATELLRRSVACWTAACREARLVSLGSVQLGGAAADMLSPQSVLAQDTGTEVDTSSDTNGSGLSSGLASPAMPRSPQPGNVALPAPPPPEKLTAEVSLVPRSDAAAKRGWLAMPAEPHSERWVRRWFVLRR